MVSSKTHAQIAVGYLENMWRVTRIYTVCKRGHHAMPGTERSDWKWIQGWTTIRFLGSGFLYISSQKLTHPTYVDTPLIWVYTYQLIFQKYLVSQPLQKKWRRNACYWMSSSCKSTAFHSISTTHSRGNIYIVLATFRERMWSDTDWVNWGSFPHPWSRSPARLKLRLFLSSLNLMMKHICIFKTCHIYRGRHQALPLRKVRRKKSLDSRHERIMQRIMNKMLENQPPRTALCCDGAEFCCQSVDCSGCFPNCCGDNALKDGMTPSLREARNKGWKYFSVIKCLLRGARHFKNLAWDSGIRFQARFQWFLWE